MFQHLNADIKIACVVIGIHTGLLAWSACIHTPNLDEIAHLPAGISIWRFGEFRAYPVNPPLVKLIAALPVLAVAHNEDWRELWADPFSRPEWKLGGAFVEANGPKSLFYYKIARLACVPFSALGALVCCCWARELYGKASGTIATVLWCSCPNVLTWGATINPDVGAASLTALAAYTFWRWRERQTWRGAVVAGTVLGLALLAKFTCIVLFAVFPFLWLTDTSLRRCLPARRRVQSSLQFLCLLNISLVLLNAGYGFRGSLVRLDSFQFISKALSGVRGFRQAGNRFVGTMAGALPVPLPAMYFQGMDIQKEDFEDGAWSYLRGEWRFGGWWYFYIYAILVKTPIGTLLLSCLSLWLYVAWGAVFRRSSHDLILLVPATVVFLLVSSQTGFSRHLRYVLPCFPFWYIWISRVGIAFERRLHAVQVFVVAFSLASVGDSLRHYPHSLSYFNQVAGGPLGGHWYLVDSNIDWGHDTQLYKEWVDAHPEARPLTSSLVDPFPLKQLGLAEKMDAPQKPNSAEGSLELTTEGKHHYKAGLAPGWYAYSIDRLHDRSNAYLGLLYNLKPHEMIGYTIYVYKIE